MRTMVWRHMEREALWQKRRVEVLLWGTPRRLVDGVTPCWGEGCGTWRRPRCRGREVPGGQGFDASARWGLEEYRVRIVAYREIGQWGLTPAVSSLFWQHCSRLCGYFLRAIPGGTSETCRSAGTSPWTRRSAPATGAPNILGLVPSLHRRTTALMGSSCATSPSL